jgi:hypothetical protein
VPAFNGRDFTGWRGPIDNYEIKDGAIACKPEKGGTIYTEKTYGDFAVRIEFLCPPAATTASPSVTLAKATPPTSA